MLAYRRWGQGILRASKPVSQTGKLWVQGRDPASAYKVERDQGKYPTVVGIWSDKSMVSG